MPKIRFIGAILLSIVLIVGALWYRFVRVTPYTAELTAVRDANQILIENTSQENFLDTEAVLPLAASTTPLTQTGVISRQLFSDYLSLKSQGQVTSESLVAIANNHAESIANFKVETPKVDQSRITVVPDTEENLTTYGNAIAAFRSKYRNLVTMELEKSGGAFNVDNAAFLNFITLVSKLYRAASDELLLLGVPASLATNHLDLINNYLGSAEAMSLFNNTSKDPIEIYAALNLYTENTSKEADLFLNIQRVLQANGIILDNGI